MPCDLLPLETGPPPKIKQKQELKKPQISHVESDDESEDELDFHYVSPQVFKPNHVIGSENQGPHHRV